MASKPLTDAHKQYIKENWHTQSLQEMAEHIHCHKSTVDKWGRKMGLGPKPDARQIEVGQITLEQRRAIKRKAGPTFFDMVDESFNELVRQRENLVEQIEQAKTMPKGGHVAATVAGLSEMLEGVEKVLCDMEEIQEESLPHRPKTPRPGEFTDIDDLLTHLNQDDVRKREGRLAEKYKMGAEILRQDWTENLHTYEDGTLDTLLLCAAPKKGKANA